MRTVTLTVNHSRSNVAFGEEERACCGARRDRRAAARARVRGDRERLPADQQPPGRGALRRRARGGRAHRRRARARPLLRHRHDLAGAGAPRGARSVGVESVEPTRRATRGATRRRTASPTRASSAARRAPCCAPGRAARRPRTTPEAARAKDASAARPGGVRAGRARRRGRRPAAGGAAPARDRARRRAGARRASSTCRATRRRWRATSRTSPRHGWRPREVRPFDMFPHTPHIECVARLDPAPAGAPAPGAR